MARVKVRLERDWRPWNDSARVGEFVRQDGALVPILVQRSSEAHTNPEQLREDGRILSSLRHPNVLRTLFLSVNNAQLIFIYERFDAVSARRLLDSVARKGRRLPVRIALELTTSAARACLAASQLTDPQAGHQLTHPGPAPDNILIDHFGQVKVAGFRALNMARENLNAPSGYIPPEGSGAPGAWTYSIGVLLVELLNNEAPSPASADPNRHEATIRRAMIRTLGRAGEPVPEQVVNLIRRCLARQPEARPGLKELIADLERIITTLRPPALKTWAPSAVSAILRRYAPAFEEQSKRNHLPVKAGPSRQQDAETSAEISVVESAEKTREKTDPVPLLLPPIVPPETPSPGPPAQVQSALVARTPNTNPHNPPPDKFRSLSEPASVQPGAIAIPQDELISDEIDWRPDRKPLYVLIGSAAVIAFAALFYAWSITPHSQTPAPAPVQSPSTTEIEPSPEPPVPGLAAEPDSDPPAPEPVPEQPSPDPEPSAAVPEPEQPSPDLEPPVPVSEPSPDSEPVAEPVTASVLEPSPDPEPVTASVLEPSPGSEPVTAPVPEPVASPESEPAVTAVSDEPPDSGPFRVEFLGVDPRMERLDVRCHQGRGQGVDRVVILNAGAGPCRVTGYINGERLVVSVSLKRAQTWRCFVDGVRACR